MDELWSGVAVSGAGSVERELSLSHAGYVTFVFALPLVAAAVLEAGVALLSDVRGRAQLVVLAQGVLAGSLGFVAWTRSPWGLSAGLAVAGAASGAACGAAQALLVASSREEGDASADRAVVKWSLYSAVGDVVTPLLTGGALALGHSYRTALGVISSLVALQCLSSVRLLRSAPSVTEGGDETEAAADPIGVALRRALRRPRLWMWLFAAASCTLLDELVIALAVLRLGSDGALGASVATTAAVAFSGGALLGAAVTDRLGERLPSRHVLIGSATLCALALAALVASHGPEASLSALFAVGVTCAPHHPLAFGRAYDELPGRPGTVQAIAQLFVVIDVGAPLALGVIADRRGLGVALGCLLVQPAIVLFCATVSGGTRKSRGERTEAPP